MAPLYRRILLSDRKAEAGNTLDNIPQGKAAAPKAGQGCQRLRVCRVTVWGQEGRGGKGMCSLLIVVVVTRVHTHPTVPLKSINFASV